MVQTRLNQINEYTKVHQLKINKNKTKIMAFNFSKKYDFLPKMSIGGKPAGGCPVYKIVRGDFELRSPVELTH